MRQQLRQASSRRPIVARAGGKTWLSLALGLLWLLSACGTNGSAPLAGSGVRATDRPAYGLPPAATRTAVVVVAFAEATGTAPPEPNSQDNAGLRATLADYATALAGDFTGAKTQAYATLQLFTDPRGMYGGAWWFADDGRADIFEVLAVILYTEGNTNFDVRTAVAARYLWYCGGTSTACQGTQLMNFLAYFQPWREPWNAPGFANSKAEVYESFAQDLVYQRSGLLTVIIPGADQYQHSAAGLGFVGPIDWDRTLFHFANVHPTWDAHLRQKLRRLPNGPARLWVFTMGEAQTVCGSRFVCADMTQERK